MEILSFFVGTSSTGKYAPIPRSDGAASTRRTASVQKQAWIRLFIAIAIYTVLTVYCTVKIDYYLHEKDAVAVPCNSTSRFGSWTGFRTDVPIWAQKNPPTIDDLQPKKELCYVHVGKTAGTTVACKLGFLYGICKAHGGKEGVDKAPGLLPASTTRLIHTDHDDCSSQDFDYYLFVVRDPLKRIQSWFTYELPENSKNQKARSEQKKPLFVDCAFRTLNQLGEEGLAPGNSENTDNSTTDRASDVCQERARFAIAGSVGYTTHNYFNFRYYLEQVQASHTKGDIVVIRTEHLDDDWRTVEEDVLHGPKGLNVTFVKRNASYKREEDSYLSTIARLSICRALCEEIQVYKELLRVAVNLNKNDYAVSMAELGESCPVEVANAACD